MHKTASDTQCDHKFVDSTYCLRCGVTFDELTREQLRDFGALFSAHIAGQATLGRGPTPRELHTALDFLLAEFIAAHPSGSALPSKTSVLELLAWNFARLD